MLQTCVCGIPCLLFCNCGCTICILSRIWQTEEMNSLSILTAFALRPRDCSAMMMTLCLKMLWRPSDVKIHIIARKHSGRSSHHLIAGGEAGAASHGHVSCGAPILEIVFIFFRQSSAGVEKCGCHLHFVFLFLIEACRSAWIWLFQVMITRVLCDSQSLSELNLISRYPDFTPARFAFCPKIGSILDPFSNF